MNESYSKAKNDAASAANAASLASEMHEDKSYEKRMAVAVRDLARAVETLAVLKDRETGKA